MKLLIANTTTTGGGAARAAYRLYEGMQQYGEDAGISSFYKALYGTTENPSAYQKIRRFSERLLTKSMTKKSASYFSLTSPLPDRLKSQLVADIIHLHWINGWMHYRTLASLNIPIVWTLHDMWLFTGGCHYDQECAQYQETCAACPMVRFSAAVRQQWTHKKSVFQQLNLTVITPSHWLADAARRSCLLENVPVHVIPNGLDLEAFKPQDPKSARQALGLHENAKVLLVGAVNVEQDSRKGLDLLQDALKHSSLQNLEHVVVLVLGGDAKAQDTIGNITVQHTGFLKEDAALQQAFCAADVVVLPSRQENLANMLAESLACGTPVAGFDIGGNKDLIHHEKTGWLSPAFDTEHLAHGLAHILSAPAEQQALSQQSRLLAEEMLCLEKVTKQHIGVYEQIPLRRGS